MTGVGGEKELEGTVRKDKMLVKETECLALEKAITETAKEEVNVSATRNSNAH